MTRNNYHEVKQTWKWHPGLLGSIIGGKLGSITSDLDLVDKDIEKYIMSLLCVCQG